MIVLSTKNLTKVYGLDVILQDVTFHVEEGDRVGIIGANGAGKTTLLKLITKEISPDSGEIFVSGQKSIGYLKQKDNFRMTGTVLGEVQRIFKPLQDMEREIQEISERIASGHDDSQSIESQKLYTKLEMLQREFEEKGGYTYKSETTGILNSMGFGEDYYHKEISTLSGGERTRLALCCLLLKKPDILLLDEPTNHLDIGTLKWLEQYLKTYKGTILIVSHDRYFLDKMVNKILLIENHKAILHNGTYAQFADYRMKTMADELKAYEKQQTEIKRQEDIIRRFKERGTEHLAKRAASREKKLEKIDQLDKPELRHAKMKLKFVQKFKSGTDVLLAEKLAKTFIDRSGKTPLIKTKKVFENVDMDIKKGEKVCIVGPNGVGKTTLLKVLVKELEPSSGKLIIGYNVMFGYYDQGQMLLNNDNTVLEELKDAYRLYSDTEMRTILGSFLFQGDSVFNKVGSLSGGEKARLSLVKLMLSGANTLVLDEPTNHLDIDSKEVFEEALRQFPGTAIIVSHDRYFLNKIPSRILELNKDGITEYLGKYDYYEEKKEQIKSSKQYVADFGKKGQGDSESANPCESGEGNNPDEPKISSAEARRLQKQQEAELRKQKRKREKQEADIDELEHRIEALEEEMCKPENLQNHQKLNELNVQLQETKDKLDVLYEEWMNN